MSAPIYKDKTNYVGFIGYTENGTPTESYYLKPISIVFHNTGDYYAPSCKSTTTYTEMYHNTDWYNPSATVAHYYVDGSTVVQMVKDDMSSWANGSADANVKYFSIEICDNWNTINTSIKEFQIAEENAFWYGAQLVRQYDLSIQDIKIHSDVNLSTACPKRSRSIHGNDSETRNYIIGRVQYYYDNPLVEPIIVDNVVTPPTKPPVITPTSNVNQMSWNSADNLTSTTNPTGTEVKYVEVSGSYPSDPYTFGHSSPSLSSSVLYFKEMSKYTGYLVDSADGIVWFKIMNIKSLDGKTIYLDLNEPGKKYFYYTSRDNATIVIPKNEGESSSQKQISWTEADKITSTSNSTGTQLKYATLSGSYPSDPYTFGHSSPSLSSSVLYFKEMAKYTGYLVDSTDGIVWFKITNIKSLDGKTIYLDLNEPGKKYFYYTSTDDATIVKV